MEYFNELCIHSATIWMLLFTDLTPEQDDQYTLGWGMIGIISFCLIFNLLAVIFFLAKNLVLVVVKYFRLF